MRAPEQLPPWPHRRHCLWSSTQLAQVFVFCDPPLGHDHGFLQLVISTSEALAAPFSLKLFHREPAPGCHSKMRVLPTWTDNRVEGSETPQDDVDEVSSVGNLAARMVSQTHGARGVDAQTSQCGCGSPGKWRFRRFRSVKKTQVNVDFIRWEILPQALDWARTIEKWRKVPRAGENCPERTWTQRGEGASSDHWNHGADTKELAIAVHSIPMVVVVTATSDRESVRFGEGFRLEDPQAAGWAVQWVRKGGLH